MIVRKKIFIMLIIIFVFVIGGGATINLMVNNPLNIFQRKFHFKLPKTVEIINSTYSYYYDCLELKISFDDDDYQKIIKGFDDYSKNNYHLNEINIENDKEMFSINAFCIWWKKEEEKAIIAYDAVKQGRWGAKTRIVCILITQNNEDKYFLHVYY